MVEYPHLKRAIGEFPGVFSDDHPFVKLLGSGAECRGLLVVDHYLDVMYALKSSCSEWLGWKIKNTFAIPQCDRVPLQWAKESQGYAEAEVCLQLEKRFGMEVVDLEVPSPKRDPGCRSTCDFRAVKGDVEVFVEVKRRSANEQTMGPARLGRDNPALRLSFEEGEPYEGSFENIDGFERWLRRELGDAVRAGVDLLVLCTGGFGLRPCRSIEEVAQHCFGVPGGLASLRADVRIRAPVSAVLLVGAQGDQSLVLNPSGNKAVRRALGETF